MVWFSFVVFPAANPADAATILEREVNLGIRQNAISETVRITVSIDEPGDAVSWSRYAFLLDTFIDLVGCRAEVLDAGGNVIRTISENEHHHRTSVGSSLHTSTSAVIIPFGNLRVGQRVRISVSRRHLLLYPAFAVPLVTEEPQRSLRVNVRGGGDRLRWSLPRAEDVVTGRETPDGLVIEGNDILGKRKVDHAADDMAALPMLLLSWSGDPSWRGVGEWYSRRTDHLDRQSTTAAELARTLTRDAGTGREKLILLAEYAKKRIRYEAVEIGEGGWIPSPADEVLKRGWGDCKDKSQLLADMLRAVGIPAHLVLLRAGRTARIDIGFPSTLGFNHCIIAVEADAIEVGEDDPVVDGLLFIDPTMDRGHPLWLSPYNQGQWVVVADGKNSRMVLLPVRVRDERRVLSVDGDIDPTGRLEAQLVLQLTGSRALSWLRDFDTEPLSQIDQRIRLYLQSVIPGADFVEVGWAELETRVPAVHFQARFTVVGFTSGSAGRTRFRPGTLTALPEPRELDGRQQPVVLAPGQHITHWRVTMPPGWCPAEDDELKLHRSVGAVSARVSMDGDQRVAIDRAVVVYRWWFGPESFEHLGELSIAENKLVRRSIRLRCGDKPELE